MNISLEAEIDTIWDEVRIAESVIQVGNLVDLATLESRIKDVCHAVSDKKQQPPVADPGALQRNLTALMERLDYLEKLVTEKKEGMEPPTSSLETA